MQLHAAIEAEAHAHLTYETHEAETLLQGVHGKNETERKAYLFVQLHEVREVCEAAEQATRTARLDLELALRLREGAAKEGAL